MESKIHFLRKPESTDPGRQLIKEYYEKLEKHSGLSTRASQRDLSFEIYDSIKEGSPAVCEAPTGTGKTIAYLIAAIAASFEKAEEEPRPIVVATATVALQDQILNGDLPKLIAAGIPLTYAGIKGRGRYFCINSAENMLTKKADRQLDFFEESNLNMVDIQNDVQEYIHFFDNENWSGELDTYPGNTRNWKYVAASPDTCIQNKCDYYEDCPFMKSRKKMNTVQILVTTQDFVLADLQMKAKKEHDDVSGSSGLLKANYILIVDEAHHFSHKAQELGTAAISPKELVDTLHSLNSIKANLLKVPQFSKIAQKVGVDFNNFNAHDLIMHLQELDSVLNGFLPKEDVVLPFTLNEQLSQGQYLRICSDLLDESQSKLSTFKLFCQGLKTFSIPENDVKLKQAVSQCLQDFTVYISVFKDLCASLELLKGEEKTLLEIAEITLPPMTEQKMRELNRSLQKELEADLRRQRFGMIREGVKKEDALVVYKEHVLKFEAVLGSGHNTKKALHNLYLYYKDLNKITWIDKYGEFLRICCTTLGGAELLSKILWKNEKINSSMLSATIGDINRFKDSVGLTHENTPTMDTRYKKFPHIFDYSKHSMYLVMLENSPKFSSRTKFIQELAQTMPKYIDSNEGTLVLFPTKSMMKECVAELQKKFPGQVLVQTSRGTQALVQEHKDKINKGIGSILCGLDTLAEGLDLPAHYCTHVIICAMPFAAAETPLEQRWQEILKDNYFKKRLLPDAIVKLVQMVGRLLRRETDYGRVTLFDNRFGQGWAQDIIKKHLPPFRQVTIHNAQNPPKNLSSYLKSKSLAS